MDRPREPTVGVYVILEQDIIEGHDFQIKRIRDVILCSGRKLRERFFNLLIAIRNQRAAQISAVEPQGFAVLFPRFQPFCLDLLEQDETKQEMRVRGVRVRLQIISDGCFALAQHSSLQERSRWSERGIWRERFARPDSDCIFAHGWTGVRLSPASQLRSRPGLPRTVRRTLRSRCWTMQEAKEAYEAGEAKKSTNSRGTAPPSARV